MKKIPFIILLAVCAGCATGGYNLTGQRRPAILPDNVKLYDTMPANAQIIGEVEANNANGWNAHWHPEMQKLKEEAAQIGANGVVIKGRSWHYFEGDKVTGTAVLVP